MDEKWPEEELGKHAYIKGRIGWRGLKSSEYKSDGPFLIAGNHIKNGQVEWAHCDHINMHRYNESWEIALKEKDIILTKDGTIGRVAIIKSLPGAATINSTMMLVRVSPPLTAEFMYHYLNSDSFQKLVEDRVSGSSIPHIFQQDMKKLKTPVPSEFEQIQIAKILDNIDEVIQRTEQLIAKLKAIKQGMLHDLLTRGLDENGQLRDPISHLEQFKDSQLGKIPKDWDVLSIREISCYVGSGLTPHGGSKVYKDFGVMFIRSQNVTFDGLKLDDIVFIDWKTHELMKRSQVFPYDVLVNITGASIGRCCYLPDGLGPTNVNQHVCAIRTPSPCHEDAIYLTSVLASYIGQHQINLFNAGSNREGLNYQQLRTIVVPWPKKEEREVISQQFLYFDGNIEAEQKYLSKLKLIKKGLMHDLLTGKIRVDIKTENLDQVKESDSL